MKNPSRPSTWLIGSGIFLILVLLIPGACKPGSENRDHLADLRITVTDPDGKRVAGATVEFYLSPEEREQGNNIVMSGETNPDGLLSVYAQEKGHYFLNIYQGNLRKEAEIQLRSKWLKDASFSIQLENGNAGTKVVKVAVVYENPIIPSTGKRFHQYFLTPGYHFLWNDPVELCRRYEAALEKASDYTIDFQIVSEHHADRFFTFLKNDPQKRLFSLEEIISLLQEKDWKTFKTVGTSYDYLSMVRHYQFDLALNRGEIDEVWVWSFPYSGMYESHMMGENAFWINSPPDDTFPSDKLLSVMGLNYERDLACALESFSHRFESTMMQVYGWWNYEQKPELSDLTTWELFSAYGLRYERYEKGAAQVGNVHYPPNGQYDYDFGNETYIESYVDEWLNYPYLQGKKKRKINRTEWGNPDGSWQLGWMTYYLGHLPHYRGINPRDGKFNDWWYYVVDYQGAMLAESAAR